MSRTVGGNGRAAVRAGAAVLAAVALLVGAGCAGTDASVHVASTPGRPQRLILISIAGLDGEAVDATRDGREAMPTARAFADDGVRADHVRGVTPTATYPAHATLVTGVGPARHGIASDHLLGERGVREERFGHASRLAAPTLWQRALEAGWVVGALDWPTTLGAAIPHLLPESGSGRAVSDVWPGLESATPQVRELLMQRLADHAGAAKPGAAHDAVLAGVACDLLRGESPPRLLLLRLSQTQAAAEQHGPAAPETRRAFAGADAEVARVLGCLRAAGALDTASVVLVGDHGFAPVHTLIAPNAVLAGEGLLDPSRNGANGWRAIARSNGGSAFVYARDEQAAVRARLALDAAAARSRAFRSVSAEEMIRAGADPGAWFGLEASPGFTFGDAASGPLQVAAPRRAAGGYLPDRPGMDTVFLAWGRGVRSGLRVPEMTQLDVAPTLAALLGLPLEGVEGRAMVGLLALEAPDDAR